MTEPVAREALSGIPAYRPGRAAAEERLSLASNENPFEPLPGVLESAGVALTRMNRYPDAGTTQLRSALGRRYGLPASNFSVGAGSVSVLFQLLRAVCEPGDHVIFPWRSFEAYPIAVQLCGATQIRVPLTPDGRHDFDEMLNEVTSLTRVVILCSPNNPTGPAIRSDELRAFLDALPRRILVVLDEAYVEFVRDPDTARGLQVFATYNNVVVLRTFSKAYGLAGLRVGYALAPQHLVEAIDKTMPPFSVNHVAEAAALASLDAEEALRDRVDHLVVERDRVVAELRSVGWQIPDSQSNFFWLELADNSEAFASACNTVGLSVRVFSGEGVRVTIGAPEANDQFLQVAREWLARS